jgi:hypothetical protein
VTKKRNSLQKTFFKIVEKEKFLFSFLLLIFFFRSPSFFQPPVNNSETLYLLSARNLLPINFFSFIDFPSLLFTKLAITLFGDSIWSVRFLLTIWILLNFTFLYYLLKNTASKKFLLITLSLLTLLLLIPSEISFTLTNFSLLSLFFINFILFLSKKFNLFNKLFFSYFPLIFLILIIFLLSLSRSFFSISYYQNFLTYISSGVFKGKLGQDQYFSKFSSYNAYLVGDFFLANTKESDTVYLVGDYSSVYIFSNRKPATSFITYSSLKNNAEKATDQINRNKPKYIALEKGKVVVAPLDRLLKRSYNRFAEIENVTIYKLN